MELKSETLSDRRLLGPQPNQYAKSHSYFDFDLYLHKFPRHT